MSEAARSTLREVVRRQTPQAAETDSVSDDDYGDGQSSGGYRAFAQLRQPRATAIMLEIQFQNGNRRAFGYSWLVEASFDPSTGILLAFTGTRVRIEGRNLDSLFVGICRHLVFRVWEADNGANMRAAGSSMVVTEVTVQE